MAFRGITAAEAAEMNPAHCCPPVCTDDADVTIIGKRHDGRVLPLVGGARPFIYDVTVVGTSRRIYADRFTDILCILIGPEYVTLADQVDAADVADRTLAAIGPGLGDVLPAQMAAVAPLPDDDEEPVDPGRRQHMMDLLYDMAILRTLHANQIRVTLQAAINTAARDDRTWEALSDFEREELTLSASPDGGYPLGIPAEVDIIDTGEDGTNRAAVMVIPEWRAVTRLVVNTGNYQPWTPAPYISAIREARQPDGSVFEYATHENMTELVIDSEPEYVQSLVEAGVLTLDERPPYQPDEAFADSPLANPYLSRQQTSEIPDTNVDGNAESGRELADVRSSPTGGDT